MLGALFDHQLHVRSVQSSTVEEKKRCCTVRHQTISLALASEHNEVSELVGVVIGVLTIGENDRAVDVALLDPRRKILPSADEVKTPHNTL